MKENNKILVIGGYGAVGKHICHYISHLHQLHVVVAGRNLNKAVQFSQHLPQASACKFDIQVPDYSAIADASVVILCIASVDNRLASYCLTHGIHYIDITANDLLIQQVEKLNELHKAPKSMALLSVGLAPGLTNLLAKHCISQHLQSDSVAINIMLGLGEKHGLEAFKWTFDNMHSRYAIQQNQQTIQVQSFTEPQSFTIDKKRRFFLFNFSDQHSLAKRWPMKNFKTRMAFDSSLLTELLFLFRKVGLTTIFRNKHVQLMLYKLFHGISLGSDRFAVRVSCGIEQQELYHASFSGKSEAKITAAVTAELATHILNSNKTGVLHIHDLVEDIPALLKKWKLTTLRFPVGCKKVCRYF